MSEKVKNLEFIKKIVNINKNSQFIRWKLIDYNKRKYNKENYDVEFLNLMKNGYEEMAEINLELSQLPFECENANINEYENWLCGV